MRLVAPIGTINGLNEGVDDAPPRPWLPPTMLEEIVVGGVARIEFVFVTEDAGEGRRQRHEYEVIF